jgi:hypothetical protein
MMIVKANGDWDRNKLLSSAIAGESSVPQFWKITFSQPTSIKTTLFINRDEYDLNATYRFPFYAATVGNNTDVT